MAEVSPAPRPRSPLPDWGKPEALMSLAFARLQLPTPDPKTAIEDAREALRLQPSWSYVKNVLVPQIEAATKTASK
jgi:hypothetical protein